MRVLIIGCGYVGLELGRQLRDAGHEPVGIRRSASGCAAIRAAGFDARRGDLTDPSFLRSLPPADAAVFLATPDDRGARTARRLHVDGLRTVIDAFGEEADAPDRLLYASTTGVYGNHGGAWVDETTPIRPPTAKLRVISRAEALVLQYASRYGPDGQVVRYAGLYGPDRYRLDRYLNGPVGPGYLNLHHRDDAAGVVRFLLDHTPERPLVLAVDDHPVPRPKLAAWLAEQCGADRPEVVSLADRLDDVRDADRRRRVRADKRCSNALLDELGYDFAFPTYFSGYQAAITARLTGQDS